MKLNRLKPVFLFLFLLAGCSTGPQACRTCDQVGKVREFTDMPTNAEITSFNVANNGNFNPDYVTTVKVKNNSLKAGTITVIVDYLYEGMDTQTQSGELHVDAESENTLTMRYDPDGLANDYQARLSETMRVMTSEEICPTCNGTGIVTD